MGFYPTSRHFGGGLYTLKKWMSGDFVYPTYTSGSSISIKNDYHIWVGTDHLVIAQIFLVLYFYNAYNPLA